MQNKSLNKESNSAVGSKAEELVCYFLEDRGYKVIERNFRTRAGEIDIVTEFKGILVFIEVKARYSHDFGLPIESITPSKLKFLKRTAEFYIHTHSLHKKQARFDLVTVDYVLGNPKIEIIENIIDK